MESIPHKLVTVGARPLGGLFGASDPPGGSPQPGQLGAGCHESVQPSSTTGCPLTTT